MGTWARRRRNGKERKGKGNKSVKSSTWRGKTSLRKSLPMESSYENDVTFEEQKLWNKEKLRRGEICAKKDVTV